MPAIKEVENALNRIDWNFPQSGSPARSIHALYSFPGNFIPQIPGFLIQALSDPGDLVLDPFSGSGTSAVEALTLGRRAIAADRVSACVYLSAAKLAALLSPLSDKAKSEFQEKLTWDQICVSEELGRNREGSDLALSKWYAPHTLAQLRYLWGLVENSSDTDRATLLMLFSHVLFACASTAGSVTASGKFRKHHWGWVADNVIPKRPVEHNAIELFRNRLFFLSNLKPSELLVEPESTVIQQDARYMALPSSSVDLIITSPPYIGMIDYTRANRLLYLWMGWSFDEDRSQEIGARFKRGRVRYVEEYEREMEECWREIHRVLRRNCYCAIVIGESRTFGGTANRMLDKLRQRMPLVWGPVARSPSRRRVSDRTARQALEYLCVFRKT